MKHTALKPTFQKTDSLRNFTTQQNSWLDEGWLFIGADEVAISLSTVCHLQGWNDLDMSPAEQEQLDEALGIDGYKPLFDLGTLSEIVANLESQHPGFSDDELERAIQFYWKRDAFIALDEAATGASDSGSDGRSVNSP